MSQTNNSFYPIGTRGTPWSAAEKNQWLAQQRTQRSYQAQVLDPVHALMQTPAMADCAQLLNYGHLDYQRLGLGRYELYAVQSANPVPDLPWLLVTGGVHGYETSGVQGALRFIEAQFAHYTQQANLLILPCVCPWGYETINRWNPDALDPNRAFTANSPVQEAALVMALLRNFPTPLVHIDLHETTNSDKSEFRPAKAARDGSLDFHCTIPDGFYLVGDSHNPQPDFQSAIIHAVSPITHIALPDAQGRLLGDPMLQHGVITYPKKGLGLCGGMSGAPYVTTTEVYPNSPRSTPEQCNRAQVAALCAGFDYALAHA